MDLITSLIWRIRYFWRKLQWIRDGRPMVKYSGFACGCCGKYWKIPYEIPEWESAGEWWDTWGLCPKGKGCNIEDEKE